MISIVEKTRGDVCTTTRPCPETKLGEDVLDSVLIEQAKRWLLLQPPTRYRSRCKVYTDEADPPLIVGKPAALDWPDRFVFLWTLEDVESHQDAKQRGYYWFASETPAIEIAGLRGHVITVKAGNVTNRGLYSKQRCRFLVYEQEQQLTIAPISDWSFH